MLSKLITTLCEISNSEKLIFCAFDDNKERTKRAHTLYGTYSQVEKDLLKLNQEGYGIFVTINHCTGPRRRVSDVSQVRALWQDDDQHFSGEFPLEPSLVVQTSPGKYQRYWFIHPETTPTIEEWHKVQKNMIHWGCDPNTLDAVRVLRVPGFDHQKSHPFTVTELDAPCTLYAWSTLIKAFGPLKKVSQREDPSYSVPPFDPNYLEAACEAIQSTTNYNNSLASISMYMANHNMPTFLIRAALRDLMQQVPPQLRDDRWEARCNHIDIYADSAVKKVSQEAASEVTSFDLPSETPLKQSVIPWPPGYLGEMAKVAYDAQFYQNQTVAVVTALGTLAGVVGRQFNVSGTGLNLYLTILMESGRGKDAIAEFQTLFLREFNMYGSYINFIGKKRFTGPKALYKDLAEKRCFLSVFTEAGYLFKSSAGDQSGLIRSILDLYTKSGAESESGGEGYSDENANIPRVRAPSFSIINEATPITLLEELQKRKSDATGELPRMNIFRVYGDKPYENENRVFSISPPLREFFTRVYKQCLDSVVKEIPDVINIIKPVNYIEFSRYCTDQENKFLEENPLKSKMYSRMAIKALKLASLCAVMNPKSRGPATHPSPVDSQGVVYITEEDWSWALKACEVELEGIDSLFAGSSGCFNFDELVDTVMIKTIIKIFNGHYTAAKAMLSDDLRKRNIISYSVIHQVVKNNQLINSLSDNKSTGLRKIIDHMLSIGLLRSVDDVSIKKTRRSVQTTYYTITKEFGLKAKILGLVKDVDMVKGFR